VFVCVFSLTFLGALTVTVAVAVDKASNCLLGMGTRIDICNTYKITFQTN